MDKNKVYVDIELRPQIESMKSGVAEIQKLLSGIKLSPRNNFKFQESFDNIEKEFTKLDQITSKGILNDKGIKDTEKSLNKIDQMYQNLAKEVIQLSGVSQKELARMIPDDLKTKIDKVKDSITIFTEKLSNKNKGTKEFNDLSKSIQNFNKKIDESNKKIKAWEKNLDRVKAGYGHNITIDGKDKQLQELKDAYDKATNDRKNANKSLTNYRSNLKNLQADYDAKKIAYEGNGTNKRYSSTAEGRNLNAQITQENEKIDEQKNKLKELEKVYDEAKKKFAEGIEIKITDENNAIEEAQKNIDNLQQKINSVSDQNAIDILKNIKQELSSVGIDTSSINSFDDLKEKLNELNKEGIQKVSQACEQAQHSIEKLGNTNEEAKGKVEGMRSSWEDLISTMNQVEQLGHRATQFFGIINSIHLFKRAIGEAYNEVKELDTAMTETAVVTDFSVGDMWDKLPEYVSVAKEFGSTVKDAYDVMTIFYQQGLDTNQVFELGTQTMQMARIAGLDYSVAADRMTNALRGFNMELNETNAQRVNDVYSELAKISASDTNELSVAMTKVASLANSANMEFENTAAFLAQMIETTRESAETAGTALKTIVARFAEVKKLYRAGDLIGTDAEGEEININKVSEALRAAGMDLNEFMSGEKGLDQILAELSSKWDSLDLMTQRYIATMAAGSRQQSRFLALMSNNQRLTELMSSAYEAEGSSAEQFAKTEDSLTFKLAELSAAWTELLTGFLNSDAIKNTVDILIFLVDALNKATKGTGRFSSSLFKIDTVLILFNLIKKTATNFLANISKIAYQYGKEAGNEYVKGVESASQSYDKSLFKNAGANSKDKTVDKKKKTKYSDIQQQARELILQNKQKLGQSLYQNDKDMYEAFMGNRTPEQAAKDIVNRFNTSVSKNLSSGSSRNAFQKSGFIKNIIGDPKDLIEAYTSAEDSIRAQMKTLESEKKSDTLYYKEMDSQLKEIVAEKEKLVKLDQEDKQILQDTVNQLKIQKAQQTAQTLNNVATAAMGLSMALGGITSKIEEINGSSNKLTHGLDTANGVLQTITTSLMDVSFILPMLEKLAVSGIPVISTAAAGLSAAIGPIAIFLTVAGVVWETVKGVTKSIEEEKQKTIDNAKAIAEEVKSNNELIDSYDELLSKKNQGENVNDELKNSAEELVRKYEIENGELLLMAENYEEIAKQAKNAAKVKATTALSDLNVGGEAAVNKLKKSRYGSDSKEINNVKNTAALQRMLKESFDKKDLNLTATVKGDSIKIEGVDDLNSVELDEYLNSTTKIIQTYSQQYDDKKAYRDWSSYMSDVSEELITIEGIAQGILELYDSYIETDDNAKFKDSSEYKEWLSNKVSTTKNKMINDGVSEEKIDNKQLENAIIKKQSAVTGLEVQFWSSLEDANEELKNYIDNLDGEALNLLKSGQVYFDSNTSRAELRQSIGKYVDISMGSLGSSSINASNNYLSSLVDGEEITDDIKFALEKSLSSAGLLDEWNERNMPEKSYAEQSDFLEQMINNNIEQTTKYYDFIEENFVNVATLLEGIGIKIGATGTETQSNNENIQKYIEGYKSAQDAVTEAKSAATNAENAATQAEDAVAQAKETSKDLKLEGTSNLIAGAALTVAGVLTTATGLGAGIGSVMAEVGLFGVTDAFEEIKRSEEILSEAEGTLIEAQQEEEKAQAQLAEVQAKFEELKGTLIGDLIEAYGGVEKIGDQLDGIGIDTDEDGKVSYDELLKQLEALQTAAGSDEEKLNAINRAMSTISTQQLKESVELTKQLSESTKLANTNLKAFNNVLSKVDKTTNTISASDFKEMLEYNPEIGKAVVGFKDGSVQLDRDSLDKMQEELKEKADEAFKKEAINLSTTLKLQGEFAIDENDSIEEMGEKILKINSAFAEFQKAASEGAEALQNFIDGTDDKDLKANYETWKEQAEAAAQTAKEEAIAEINAINSRVDAENSAFSTMAENDCSYAQSSASNALQLAKQWAEVTNAKEGNVHNPESVQDFTGNIKNTYSGSGSGGTYGTDSNGNITVTQNDGVVYTVNSDGTITGARGEIYHFDGTDWVNQQGHKSGANEKFNNITSNAKAIDDAADKKYNKTLDENGNLVTNLVHNFLDNLSNNEGTGSGGGGGGSADPEEVNDALDKILEILKKFGFWTLPAQLAILEKKKDLLFKEYGIEKKTFLQRLKEFSLVEGTNNVWDSLIEKFSDGQLTVEEGFSLIREQFDSLKDFSFEDILSIPQKIKDLFTDPLSRNGLTGTKPLDDEFWSKFDEINQAEFEAVESSIDDAVDKTNNVIDTAGQLASDAISMIQAVADAAIEGFNSYFGWLTMKIDDDHDIGQLDTSLSNIIDRLDWEYEKLLKKSIAYQGMDALNEKEVFENSNQMAKNTIARMQNQRRLYENSFRQLEDLSLNISSELTEAFESLYDRLYGMDGPFTKLNQRINSFKGKLEDVLPNTTSLLGEVKGILGNVFQKGQDKLTDWLDNIFPNSILDDMIENFAIDNYQLGDFGKSKMQKIIELFTELTPSFNADYQIANKAELLDALNQKMSTIITNDTITSKFISNYLNYLTEVEGQMEAEVENIRSSEKELLNMYDSLTEILERGKEEYSTLAQNIFDAITNEKNSLIEELTALNDSITTADSDLLDVLRQNLELIRQERENDKTEEDLLSKERRLAYLKQDTSGANLQEILQLQKELEDSQQSYTDQLIDQKIDELENQNTDAAEQRQVQIDLLQEEVNNTEGIWKTVEELLSGIAKFDKYLTGEVDRDGYAAIIAQLKKNQDYIGSSLTDKQESEEEWDRLIRAASLYRQVKDNLSEEYQYLKLASAIIDEKTGLPEEYSANEGWHNYVAFSTLEQSIDRTDNTLKEAITAINNLVEKITVSYNDEQSLHMKATYYGGLIQAVSGTEYAATKAIEDLASDAPGILTQLVTGTGNLAKGAFRLLGSGLDTGVAGLEDLIGFVPDVFGNGVDGGGAVTTFGDIGEGIGFIIEGFSNFAAAAADAGSMGMNMIGDMAPGFADIGVAVATALKETFFNDYEKVNNELEENIDTIIDIIGNSLGNSGYLKDIKEGIQMAKNTKMGQPEDASYPIYEVLAQEYQDILADYRNLLSRDTEKTDIEGYNKLYSRISKLREILNGFANWTPEDPENYEGLDLDPARALEAIEKWRGEIGTLFTQIDGKVKDEIVSLVNGILSSEGKTLGNKNISRWIDIYDGILMLDASTQSLSRLASAMEEYEPELANKLYKLFDRKYELENTPQESFVSFWSHKLNGIWGDVSEFFEGFWDKLKNFFSGGLDNLKDTLGIENGTGISKVFEKMEDYLKFGQIDDSKSVQSVFAKIWSWIEDAAGDVESFIKNIIEKIKNWLIPSSTYATGGTITQRQTALVGEAGAELIQYAHGGAALATGPSMANLGPGDIVYNASQTKEIFGGGNLNFSRFAEGTAPSLMNRDLPVLGVADLFVGMNTDSLFSSEINKANNFNFNLQLEGLTVDSVDRVEEVANKVWNKITTNVSNAIWPYNRL